MKMQLSELTTERKWRAATGLNEERFYKLLERFKVAYEALYKKSIEQKQEAEKHFDFGLSNEEELLYFTLFSLKSGLTYDLLGLVGSMNASSAQKNQAKGLKILARAALGEYMSTRTIKTKEEFDNLFGGIEKLLIDATESPKQRPSNNEEQKKYYSGKKKSYIKSHVDNHKR
ncbi:MAG: hypothetical protein HC877_09975 [Thioploca sp.]|nr:hypothetical protein [Thioploca sp.]